MKLRHRIMLRCMRVARWRNKDPQKEAFMKAMQIASQRDKRWRPNAFEMTRILNLIEDNLTPREIEAIHLGAPVTPDRFPKEEKQPAA